MLSGDNQCLSNKVVCYWQMANCLFSETLTPSRARWLFNLFLLRVHNFASRTSEQKDQEPYILILLLIFYASEFLKVFSSNGTEIFTREHCYEDHRGVVELHFGEGNFVTLHTQLYSSYSRLSLEFVVVRRSLQTGIPRKSLFHFFFLE